MSEKRRCRSYYRGQQIGTCRVDFFVEDSIMVELKAVIRLEDVHLAQAINYLEAYNMQVGLLLNFGAKKPGVQAGPQQPLSGRSRESLNSVNLTNTGPVAGKEVVQVYVHDRKAGLMRPPKEAQGFRQGRAAARRDQNRDPGPRFKGVRLLSSGVPAMDLINRTETPSKSMPAGSGCPRRGDRLGRRGRRRSQGT